MISFGTISVDANGSVCSFWFASIMMQSCTLSLELDKCTDLWMCDKENITWCSYTVQKWIKEAKRWFAIGNPEIVQ